jgi:transposase, IS5 family
MEASLVEIKLANETSTSEAPLISQDRYEPDKVFIDILKLTHEMDPVLAKINQFLDDEVLYQLIRSDLAQRFPMTEQTGRNSTSVEVILRMLAIKRLYRWSNEQTEYQVRDSLVLRQFCQMYLIEVPDDTTLLRWAGLIQPKNLEQFNQRLTELATQLKVTQGRILLTDGTVVETNIHPPATAALLSDGVRVLGRTLSRARHVLVEATNMGQEVFRNRVRSARRLARQVGEALRRTSDTAKTEGQLAYRRLVKTTWQTLRQVEEVLPVLNVPSGSSAALGWIVAGIMANPVSTNGLAGV